MNNPAFSEDPKSPRFTVLVEGDELRIENHVTEKITINEAQKRLTQLSKAVVQATLNHFQAGEEEYEHIFFFNGKFR